MTLKKISLTVIGSLLAANAYATGYAGLKVGYMNFNIDYFEEVFEEQGNISYGAEFLFVKPEEIGFTGGLTLVELESKDANFTWETNILSIGVVYGLSSGNPDITPYFGAEYHFINNELSGSDCGVASIVQLICDSSDESGNGYGIVGGWLTQKENISYSIGIRTILRDEGEETELSYEPFFSIGIAF